MRDKKIEIYKFNRQDSTFAERKISPSPIKRAWIENNHFYRCLPMTISNQNGWVVECPSDFKASWIGQPDKSAVHFWIDKNYNFERKWVDTIFGYGVITFFMDFIVRTPPGVNLLVRGAPNFYVKGAHPLEGIVETDWLNFTFTMNWKITEPDSVVHFRKGDPICYFQPIPHDYSEEFDIEIDLIDSNPELKEKFLEYNESRDKFRADTNKKSYWQGHYFRGEDVSDGIIDSLEEKHSTKLGIATPKILY